MGDDVPTPKQRFDKLEPVQRPCPAPLRRILLSVQVCARETGGGGGERGATTAHQNLIRGTERGEWRRGVVQRKHSLYGDTTQIKTRINQGKQDGGHRLCAPAAVTRLTLHFGRC